MFKIKKKPKKLTPEEERVKQAEAQRERQERIERCKQEIEPILKKYNCTLTAQMLVSQNGNFPQITIVALEEKKEV